MSVTVLNTAVGVSDNNTAPVVPSAGVDRYWRISLIYKNSAWASQPTQIQVAGDTTTTLDRINSFVGTSFVVLTFGCNDAAIGTNPSTANGDLTNVDGAMPSTTNIIIVSEVLQGVDQTTPFTDTVDVGWDAANQISTEDCTFTLNEIAGAYSSVHVASSGTATTWNLAVNGYSPNGLGPWSNSTRLQAFVGGKAVATTSNGVTTTFTSGVPAEDTVTMAIMFLPAPVTHDADAESTDIVITSFNPIVKSGLVGEFIFPTTASIQVTPYKASVLAGPPEFPGLVGSLSSYTLVGSGVSTFPIGNNASGAGYNHETQKVYIVRNNTAEVHEYAEGDYSVAIRIITSNTSFKDTEGVTYLGNDRYGLAIENGGRYVQSIHTFPDGVTSINVGPDQELTLAAIGVDNNSGLEGNTVNLNTGQCYGVGEGEQGSTDRKFFTWNLPVDGNTDYSYTDAELTVTEPFVAETAFAALGSGGTFDLSGCSFDHTNDTVLICSHRGRKIIQIDPTTGTVLSELDVPDLSQMEGVQILANGIIMAMGEANEYQIFEPNLSPGEVLPPVKNIVITAYNATVSSASLTPPVDATLASITITTYRAVVLTGIQPVITQPPHATIAKGDTFSYTPTLDTGEEVFWYKEYGPDGMTVDPETGEMSWDSSVLTRGQGIKVGLACSNVDGEDTKWFIIHVDNTGTSKLVLLGTDTVSPYIRLGSMEAIFNSGDTLAVPAGHRWASVASDESYENTYADTFAADMPAGTNTQLTTIMSEEFSIIDSSPHDGIPRQNEALEITPVVTASQYVKFSGIEWTGNNRQAILSNAQNCVMELVGCTDSGYNLSPTTFIEADGAYGSVAAGYQQGGGCVWENCYAFGQFRYGLQFGVNISSTLASRNLIRPDEYHGDQPRGGLVHYTVSVTGAFNNFVVDGDQEHLSPFYKNYAGAFAYPATGNETIPYDQVFDSNLTMNTFMAPVTNDAYRTPTGDEIDFIAKNLVVVNCTGTKTPQTGSVSPHVFRSKPRTTLENFTNYEVGPYEDSTSAYLVQSGSVNIGEYSNGIVARAGWDGATNVDYGPLTSGNLVGNTLDNVNVHSFPNSIAGDNFVASNTTTTNPLVNGLDYITRTEEGSPLNLANQGANILTFANPSNVMPGDVDWRTPTNVWCWPHPAEVHIASRMATYSKTGLPVRNATVGVNPTDFTGTIDGDRGFATSGESFSEYVWGYLGRTVPPLRVEVKQTTAGNLRFYVGRYRSSRGSSITKFNIYDKTDMLTPVASFTGLQHTVSGVASGSKDYVIRAVDSTKVSAYGANETGESGNSRTLSVVVEDPNATAVNATNVTVTVTKYNATVVSTDTVPAVPVHVNATNVNVVITMNSAGVTSTAPGDINIPIDNFPIYVNYQTKPSLPDLINSPIIAIGDDVSMLAQLLRSYRMFEISATTDISASIISLDRSTSYTSSIVQTSIQNEADWNSSLVNVTIAANITAQIGDLTLDWNNGILPAWLEIQLTTTYGRNTYFIGVNLSKSTI